MNKNCLYVIFFLLLIGCSNRVIEKPQNLIPQEQMEEILYDIAFLNAVKNVDYQLFEKNMIDVDKIIYDDNQIDSLQLIQNMVYYTSVPELFEQMIIRINNRAKLEDSLYIAQQKKQDSLAGKQNDLEALKPLNPEQ